ncbi:50S ribosomal protein L1 [candidate division WWE3 bacterium]|nr:50S ribosomal protein L1 [candidate division WWE3 bacterium]
MTYTVKEAVKKVKENATEKFDASVEAHINLKVPENQTVRFTTTLPEGTGKERKVAVMSSEDVPEADLQLKEADIAKIKKGELSPGEDFDVFIAEPRFMSKIAQVAPILGPAGVMPNPKSGTVTENVQNTVKDFKSGQIEVRTEPSATIIHTVIGKVSWDDERLASNLNHLLTALRSNRPVGAKQNWIKSVYVTSSMGPSFEVSLE